MNIAMEIEKPKSRVHISPANELSQSQLLWRSVLAQAVRDMYSDKPSERMDVLKWLKTRDFDTVCDFAHVEPSTMREQLSALAALPYPLARKYGKMLKDKIMESVHV